MPSFRSMADVIIQEYLPFWRSASALVVALENAQQNARSGRRQFRLGKSDLNFASVWRVLTRARNHLTFPRMRQASLERDSHGQEIPGATLPTIIRHTACFLLLQVSRLQRLQAAAVGEVTWPTFLRSAAIGPAAIRTCADGAPSANGGRAAFVCGITCSPTSHEFIEGFVRTMSLACGSVVRPVLRKVLTSFRGS